jgi:hypothetical protein
MDKSMGCIFIHIYLTFWIHPFSHHPIHTMDLSMGNESMKNQSMKINP